MPAEAVMYIAESVATLKSLPESPFVHNEYCMELNGFSSKHVFHCITHSLFLSLSYLLFFFPLSFPRHAYSKHRISTKQPIMNLTECFTVGLF